MKASFLHLLPAIAAWVGILHASDPEIWAIKGGTGHLRNVLLFPGGTAVATVADRFNGRGLRGFWHGAERSRTVLLESGHGVEIRIDRKEALAQEIHGGKADRTLGRLSAEKQTGPAGRWIGVWIWETAQTRRPRYVSLSSGGLAVSQPGTHGRWVAVNRGIRVEWNDGAIDLLQFSAGTPVLQSWPPGVRTNATPPLKSIPCRVGERAQKIEP